MGDNPVISKILMNEEPEGGTKVSLVILAEDRKSVQGTSRIKLVIPMQRNSLEY